MQYVFLVGGLGTRLGQKTQTTPKPLLEIAGKPFLLHLVHWARWAGAHDIVLLSGYKGDQISGFAQTISSSSLRVRVVQEETLLGTGGSLFNAQGFLEDEFIVSNGDSWLAFDPRYLSQCLNTRPQTKVVMALRLKQDTSSSGIVNLNEKGIISAFKERGDGTPGLINAGVYGMRKNIFDQYRPKDRIFSIEKETFPALIPSGTFEGKVFDGYFIDIGTPERFKSAEDCFSTAFNAFIPKT